MKDTRYAESMIAYPLNLNFFQQTMGLTKKRNMLKRIILFSFLIFTLAACTKELDDKMEDSNQQDPISETPVIALISVSTNEVTAYEDPLIFKISYIDGDGDLGTDDPDIYSIELIDNRDPALFVFNYHLSPRIPDGSSLTVQGELDIVLDNSILLDDDNDSEMTTFSIRIKDEAGNWSNVVETAAVEIVK